MMVPLKLRQARQRRSLTQGELADLAGVAKQTIHRAEAGIGAPRPSVLRKIAAALDVEPSDLMTEER